MQRRFDFAVRFAISNLCHDGGPGSETSEWCRSPASEHELVASELCCESSQCQRLCRLITLTDLFSELYQPHARLRRRNMNTIRTEKRVKFRVHACK